MRLAFISDIHSNIQALVAVNKFLESQVIDQVIVVGDIVGYGANPGAVIDFIRYKEYQCCTGSSDARVALGNNQNKREGIAEDVIVWTREIITQEQRNFLLALPTGGRLRVPGGRVRFFHGGPTDPDDNVTVHGSDEKLVRLAQQFPAVLIVAAGSHVPNVKQINGVTFLDPGSVGLSLNHKPGADVAIVDLGNNGQIRVRMHKVSYDYDAAAFDIMAWNLPEYISQVIKTARG